MSTNTNQKSDKAVNPVANSTAKSNKQTLIFGAVAGVIVVIGLTVMVTMSSRPQTKDTLKTENVSSSQSSLAKTQETANNDASSSEESESEDYFQATDIENVDVDQDTV